MKGLAFPALIAFVVSSFVLIGVHEKDPVMYTAQGSLRIHAAGALAGFTGAPGEPNCTQCHGGLVQDGSTENIFQVLKNGIPATEYTPGETYELTLELASAPDKKGFEVTVLDENNTFAGSFTAGTNSQIKNGASRKYVTHTGSSNAPDGWAWSWTAPDEIVGEIRFYIAANKANGNGSSSGDVIFLSQHAINTSASVKEESLFKNLQIGYNRDNRRLTIGYDFPHTGNRTVNLVDLSRNSVFYKEMGTSFEGSNLSELHLPESIGEGMYIVQLMVGNHPVSRKVLIH